MKALTSTMYLCGNNVKQKGGEDAVRARLCLPELDLKLHEESRVSSFPIARTVYCCLHYNRCLA